VITVGNEKRIVFDPFCLDLANEFLWRGSHAIKLAPKAFAVLHYLLGRPSQLVTKEKLLDAIWRETFVGEAVLKVAIRQIREALGDDPKSPRFIETAHRRGYRFIGQIAESEQTPANDQEIRNNRGGSPLRAADPPQRVVGRGKALSRMQGWLGKMLGGERQIVFVTGEAGIGKTALVDTFARSIASHRSIRTARGQCLEQYGTSEAYLPVLEAMGRLCREQGQVVEVLRAHAPMWLLQMPSLTSSSDRELLSRELSGATRERMLREMGGALEALTADQPLVLILEDLHWSDYSTLDLISYLARQRHAAQLMLIGTYRTVELIVSGHPLKAVKQELVAKQQCEELPLEYLSEKAIVEYLCVRFPTNRFPAKLAGLIHERTEGNPLFMVNAVNYLVTEGLIVEHEEHWDLVAEIEKVEVGVPDSIKQMIEKQIDHLNPEQQRTLEAASMAGLEFSSLSVVAGLGEDRAAVEARCDELARQRQFIQNCGVQELPNREAASRYGFIHDLYQNVLYQRVSASRRVQLHRRIGERGEDVYGERAGEIAAELAMHFEQARDYQRAVKYLEQAAENAAARFASHETVTLSRRALELLKTLPETSERAQQELALRIMLGVSLIATEGYAASEVEENYRRAHQLCQQQAESPRLFPVLWGLWAYYLLREEVGTALAIAEQLLCLGQKAQDPILLVEGHWALGVVLAYGGEFTTSLQHLEQAIALYAPSQYQSHIRNTGHDPAIASRCQAAWVLWSLGYSDRAFERIGEALAMAEELRHHQSVALAEYFAAYFHQLRQDVESCVQRAQTTIGVATEHGLIDWVTLGTIQRGWAFAEQGQVEEGVAEMRRALAEYKERGTALREPYFLGILADVLRKTGKLAEALKLLTEALAAADHSGDRSYEAELYRLKGETLLMRAGAVTEAENCFHRSVEIARRQHAKSWELRSTVSLARLYQQQGKPEEAQRKLEESYSWFTEGFATPDLRAAKALLDDFRRVGIDAPRKRALQSNASRKGA